MSSIDNSKKLTYKDSGVDIHAGYETVRRIKVHAKSTYGPEVLNDLGSFGGLFAFDQGKFEEPVLVSGTDGVGTKLKIAFLMDKHDTVGLDLVAYCVNDIICHGAKPLFFLDYLAVGKLATDTAEQIVAGIAAGCRKAGCALIGGETAEMPGFYAPGEYDLAGFAVGVVDKSKIIDGSTAEPGDVLVGIGSTGLQSSGFSLVRKALLEKFTVDTFVPEFGRSLGEELLEPTGIYAKQINKLVEKYPIKGIANISGGGLPENLPRSLADGCGVLIKKGSWPVLPVFDLLQREGNIDEDEMYNTFNMGIAMVLVVSGEDVDSVQQDLKKMGEQSFVIGEVVRGEKTVAFAR
ncbi:MAG: phosphoribosylformylglycinamidine cyclo-ligase [Limnochordia bacterium]|nr:phosphoribosylformylglycinamidine cyclo-ligase [Limnochordia bacterium]MDD4518320.1 phosphoribosylformylglycinamidine cyclo-ligase [Limnochordia bacterium]